LDAPYNRGLALLELSRLFEKRAHTDPPAGAQWREKALVALEEAVEAFESLGATYDLQVARALRSQLQAEMAEETAHAEGRAGQVEVMPSHLKSAPPEGEWHTAAVVWLSLSPPPDADEEAVFETMALVLPGLQTIAREYQGQVIRRQDGLTVVFGAPTAYEDDAERAVQTAWQMAAYLREPAHQTEVPLTFSVAVNQGDVVAGHIGSHFHSEFVVRGEPVTVAQRVAESVPAGVVWVTEAVRAATERLFVYEPAAPHVETPLAELSLWELSGLRERPAPARGLPGLGARLIGRDTPLKTMTDLSRNLSQGFGGLVWIEGEPGIGKSRLMREFADSFVGTDTLIWTGGCSPQRSGHALSLFSDLLAQVLGLQPTDTSDQMRAKIDQTIQAWPKDAQVTRPYLEMLLGLQPGGLHGERLATLEPEQLRQQTFVALRRLFKSMASKQPMVIMLDDLHWVDTMSVELMQFLLTMVASAPILFVCAQRRQGADLPNERLVRLHSLIPTQTVRFCLERLSTPESETLLSELISQAAVPDALRITILERSEGNPYFVEEFVRLLIEQGYLRQRQGRWELDTDLSLEDIPLPSSLETLIRSRVDALPAELKGVMQYAAVIGAPFAANLLESVSELPNVEAALRRLASRLLVRRGPEADQWVFNHTLIESVTYHAMLKARREIIHLHVGQALEARWVGAGGEHAEELAYHFARADEGAKALTYLVLAGERAAARYANEEAINYFEQAAFYLSAQPDTTDRLRWRLAAGLGDAYRSVGKYVDSKAALAIGLVLVETGRLADDLAAGLYRRLGETTQKQGELDAALEHFTKAINILGEPVDRKVQIEAARTMTGLAWNYFLQGRFDQAQEACEASLAHARRVNALSELASAENLLGGVHYRQSKWAPALHHTRRAMVLREQMGYTWGVAATLSNQGILAVSAGDWNRARTFFERSLALREELGDVEGVAIVHNNLGTLTRDQGDLELAEHHFRASLAQAERLKIDFHVANSTIGLAQVLLLKGEIAGAQEATGAALAQAEAIGAQDMLAEIYCIQAEILLAQSAWDKARALLEQCVDLTAETGNRGLEAAAWRVASEVELLRGDPVAAREALVAAQKVLADATNELEAGRVAAQEGRISLKDGDPAGAEKNLRVAQEIFMRLGARLDLRQVEETLEGAAVRESDALLRRLESI
jgi:predicted ATPase